MIEYSILEVFDDGVSETFDKLMKMDFIKKLIDEHPKLVIAKDIKRLSEIADQPDSNRRELVAQLLNEIAHRSNTTLNEDNKARRLSW